MHRRLLGLVVLISLLLAACGGGGDDNSAGAGATSGGGGTTAGGGDQATGATGNAADVIPAAQCAQVAAAMAAAAEAMPAAMSGSPTDLDQSLEQMRAFADAAPEEIRDDMNTIVEGYAKIAEAMQSAGYDLNSGEAPPPEVIAALGQVGQELSSAEFQAAVDHVNAYFASCNG